mmetsp:Transcript_5724/g.16831  ORF Transcript_5724/g.16831 Transcript_5724/m.16831 type:complete len:295 (-) Transcript_5724:388-1272(-)
MPSGSSFTEVMTLTPSCFHRSISSTVIGNRPVLSAKKKTVTGAMEACASKAGQESKLFACENPSEPLATITIGALIVSETIALSNVFSFEKSGLENPKPRGMEIFIFTFGSNFAKCVSSSFLLSTINCAFVYVEAEEDFVLAMCISVGDCAMGTRCVKRPKLSSTTSSLNQSSCLNNLNCTLCPGKTYLDNHSESKSDPFLTYSPPLMLESRVVCVLPVVVFPFAFSLFIFNCFESCDTDATSSSISKVIRRMLSSGHIGSFESTVQLKYSWLLLLLLLLFEELLLVFFFPSSF